MIQGSPLLGTSLIERLLARPIEGPHREHILKAAYSGKLTQISKRDLLFRFRLPPTENVGSFCVELGACFFDGLKRFENPALPPKRLRGSLHDHLSFGS